MSVEQLRREKAELLEALEAALHALKAHKAWGPAGKVEAAITKAKGEQ